MMGSTGGSTSGTGTGVMGSGGMSLSDPTQVTDAMLSHAVDGTVTAADMQMMGTAGPTSAYAQAALVMSPIASITDPATFVTLMYEDMLGRAADAGGLQYWVGAMKAGTSQAAVMMGFANSSEALTHAQSAGWLNAMSGTNGASPVIGVTVSGQTQAMEAIMAHAMNGAVTTAALQMMSTAASPTAYAQATLAASPLASVADPTTFVSLMYQDMLGRAPDAGGLQYWVGAMNAGTSQATVMMGFANSAEALAHAQSGGWMSGSAGTGAATGITLSSPTQVMEAIMSHALNGTVSTADAQMMTTASSATAYAQSALAASAMASVTDATTFVTDMYQNMLGRAPDAAGLQYWTNQITSNGGDRSVAMVGFANSTEALMHAHAAGWL